MNYKENQEPQRGVSRTMETGVLRAATSGLLALAALLGVYFGSLTLVSGWRFTLDEYSQYYYTFALAVGFGVQVGLFVFIRRLVRGSPAPGRFVAASGATSTAAMVSCCTHYLANLLPIVGAAGLVTLAAQYQVELFWLGIVFNVAGITYMGTRVAAARRDHAHCVAPG